MLKRRYLTRFVREELKKKMVFIGGPRQVGKTTLSRELLGEEYHHLVYLSWDLAEDRKKILGAQWQVDADLIILDELHKAPDWKTLIKGFYDKWKREYRFLVTGSARLDVYRKGGDSLQGRYLYYRLHPFSLAEMCDLRHDWTPFEPLPIESTARTEELETLLQFGGFPEPLLHQDERERRQWHRNRVDRLIREDIRELEPIRHLAKVRLLSDILPTRVGSSLSLNALREDLGVSHRAVTHWMNILEEFYYHYRIYPYAHDRIRSLKKEAKLFLWDWSDVEERGPRFENLLASHLLKFVHLLEDYGGYRAQLHYLRDREGREVDFLVTIDGKPWFACEAKLQAKGKSSNLRYFGDRLEIPYLFQVHCNGDRDYLSDGIRFIPAAKFLTGLV